MTPVSELDPEHQDFVAQNKRIERALELAYQRQKKSFRDMYQAVLDAREAGWSNAEIGYVIGMTEGGVRQMVKRRSKQQYYH